MRSVGVDERRARLARRHFLAPGSKAADAVEAARGVVGLHASDPATVYLSAWARVDGFDASSLERALYEDATARKHLAMRRTLFVLPTDLVPVVQAACTDAILANERRRIVRDVEAGGVARDGARWLRRAEQAVVRALEERGPLTGAELSRGVPELEGTMTYGEGKSWGGEVRFTGRVLNVLAASGEIVRGRPTGTWTSSRHRWELLRGAPARMPEDEARADLVRRYLLAFGPVTETDVAWWTGLGLRPIRAALTAVRAVTVDLDGETGFLAADDVEPVPAPGPWAALVPGLDPTTMGWKRREWYLGSHAPVLFDRAGNAGPAVWWNGRIVGGWAQRPDGEIAHRLLDDVGADARAAVDREAARLRAWLGETVVGLRFPTPLSRELAA